MSEAGAAPRQARVLLLAGEVRDAWAAALAPEFDVATTGWLDGVTAARLRRPDVVVVGMDLPGGAAAAACRGFRSAMDLRKLPIVVAGDGAYALEAETSELLRADRYVPVLDGAALAAQVRDLLRVGRARLPKAARIVAGACGAVLVLAMLARIAADAFFPALRTPAFGVATLAVAVAAALAAGVTVAVARPRPVSPFERRRALAWAGMWLIWIGTAGPHWLALAKMVAFSLALGAWATWAWLGPRV